jgi:phage shock protein C
MKKTINISLGEHSFIIDEDAFNSLENYLERSKESIAKVSDDEGEMIMLEARMADLLKERLGGREVLDYSMVHDTLVTLGYPEGYNEVDDQKCTQKTVTEKTKKRKTVKKFFRDHDQRKIAGVCSGLALYFNIDVVILRIIFVICLFWLYGLWIYLIIWLVAPSAKTPTEKCEQRGLPPTAENIEQFIKDRKSWK